MSARHLERVAATLIALAFGFAVASAPTATATASTATTENYWLLSSTGQVFAYGKAHNYGSEYRKKYKGTITAIKGTANGNGYWIITSKTHYSFGDATHDKYKSGGTTKYKGKIKPKGLRGKIVSIARAKLVTTTKTTTTKTSTTPTKTTTTTTPDCSSVAINLNPSTHIITHQGTAFTQTLTATGPTGSWTWTASPGDTAHSTNLSTLPSGLNLSSDGAVSGTPTTDGQGGWVTITATDSTCPSDPVSVQQYFLVEDPYMAITTSSLTSGQANDAYSQTMTATGGDVNDYDWTATGLPAGLSMSTPGVLSGTPTESDASTGPTNYNVSLTVSDPDSEVPSASQGYTLTISPAALTFVTTTLTAVEGQSYSGTVVMTGGVSPYHLSLAEGSNQPPSGLTFNDDGTITGTPTASAGSYTFTVDAADSQTFPYEATETFHMEIAPSAVAPDTTVTGSLSAGENWSGYVEHGSSVFTSVGGSFVVPSAPTVDGDFASTWAGIDDNSTIIQAGVSDTGTNNGTVLYQAWWETYPSAVQNIFDVSLGDTVNVYIWQVSSGEWEITLNDVTNGQGFAVEEPYAGAGATAEWIIEGGDGNPATFYNGTVTFTNLQTSSAGTGVVEYSMDDVFGVSTPSALNSVGFNVASSTTAPPAP